MMETVQPKRLRRGVGAMHEESGKHEACFVELGGLSRVYVPGCGSGASRRKHPCPDCHFCQDCSDARCHACRRDRTQSLDGWCPRKLSLREQVALYEALNRSDADPSHDSCPAAAGS